LRRLPLPTPFWALLTPTPPKMLPPLHLIPRTRTHHSVRQKSQAKYKCPAAVTWRPWSTHAAHGRAPRATPWHLRPWCPCCSRRCASPSPWRLPRRSARAVGESGGFALGMSPAEDARARALTRLARCVWFCRVPPPAGSKTGPRFFRRRARISCPQNHEKGWGHSARTGGPPKILCDRFLSLGISARTGEGQPRALPRSGDKICPFFE
jgi:hypothetical protein